jgi:hypothetical protein
MPAVLREVWSPSMFLFPMDAFISATIIILAFFVGDEEE